MITYKIFDVSINNNGVLNITINLLFFCASIAIVFVVIKGITYLINRVSLRNNIYINEVELGIGSNSKLKLSYDYKDKQIAYQIWVEISTRKLGLPFEEGKDVIVEVYNSWYNFFGIVRELIKSIPVRSINLSDFDNGLVEMSTKILNKGIRPHLTTFQARFRKWYEIEVSKMENIEKSPQDIQNEYDQYDQLVDDIKQVNKIMIEYKKYLYKIAFNKRNN